MQMKQKDSTFSNDSELRYLNAAKKNTTRSNVYPYTHFYVESAVTALNCNEIKAESPHFFLNLLNRLILFIESALILQSFRN